MSNNSLFDDITRILASPIPRREAFRQIASGLASGTLGFLLKLQHVYAQAVACANVPPGTDCSTGTCAAGSTCMEFGGKCTCRQNCTTHVWNGVLGNCHTLPCPNNGECRDPKTAGTKCFCHPPYCSTTTSRFTVIGGPPTQAEITTQNAVEGINAVTLTAANNCNVTTAAGIPVVVGMPLGEGGTTAPVEFVATKIDQTERAQFAFIVCGPDGLCCPVDPIFTVLRLGTGRWVKQAFADVPPAEHFVTVTNGDPGLQGLHIWVNSRHYATLPLRDNETQNLDLAAAMTQGNNSISLAGTGELGGSAAVTIGDIPPAQATSHGGATVAAAQALGAGPRHNPIWGALAEATEENSDLQAASASTQTVQIVFSGALRGAAKASAFTAEVNGKAVTVQGAHVQGSAAGTQLTLQLPQGTLHSGDSVDVYWENLPDAKGRPLSGHVPLFAQ